jgi:hypothetical protein
VWKSGLQVDVVYTAFSKAFDIVNHGLLVGTLTPKLRGPMICWMGSYLPGRTQRVRVGDYLSQTITQKNKLSHGANPASDKFLSAADKFIYLQQINFICSK